MLMGGRGKRISKFKNQKPFLIYKKKPIYKYIFDRFGAKKKIIITNKNYIKKINKKSKFGKKRRLWRGHSCWIKISRR